MITKQQITEKTKELAGILLAGGGFDVADTVVHNAYFINCVKDSNEFDRLMRKVAAGLDINTELFKLCELEALKIADEYALDILEMEQEK